MATVTYDQIRKAVYRQRFQDMFPELTALFDQYIRKPGCGSCEEKLFSELLTRQDRLRQYFGDDAQFEDVGPAALPPHALSEQSFMVINCKVEELSARLNSLQPGSYEIAAARWQDEITVIIKVLA